MRDYVESYTAPDGTVFRNSKPDGYAPKLETGTVPAGLIVELDESIAPNSTLTITVNGAPVIVKPWEFAPAAGEVSIHKAWGLIKMHSSAVGQAISVTYIPGGTVLLAGKLSSLIDA